MIIHRTCKTLKRVVQIALNRWFLTFDSKSQEFAVLTLNAVLMLSFPINLKGSVYPPGNLTFQGKIGNTSLFPV